MAKEREEKRDELGFTPSDYEDMQKLSEREGKLGDVLKDGWDITPEQITLINSPCHPLHRITVIAFYDVNFKRLRRMAVSFLSNEHHGYLTTVVDYEDLLQQVFCDLLCGFLKLAHDSKKINAAIYRCFNYTAVGGLEGLEDVKAKRATRT